MSNPNQDDGMKIYGGIWEVVRIFVVGLSIVAIELVVHGIAAWQVWKWITR